MSFENAYLNAALDFAARGWPVFPCNPRTKRPLLPKDVDAEGKPIKGSGGVSKASLDHDQICEWWKRWPKAMVGLATGYGRLFVLDFDPRHDEDTGEEWTLERLKDELEAQMGVQLPSSLSSRTPSGGVHVWLTWPDDDGQEIRNSDSLPEHVDVRGKGGYVIAPPSINADGVGYRWLHNDSAAPIVEAPAELVEILRRKREARPDRQAPPPARRSVGQDGDEAADDIVRRYALSALEAECRLVETAASGSRNPQLNKSAFAIATLVASGALRESVARAAIEDAARRNPGRDDDAQLIATIDSGWTAGIQKPRDLSEVAAAAKERADRRARRSGPSGALRPGAAGEAPSAPSAPGPSPEDYGLPSFQMEDEGEADSWGSGGESHRISMPVDPERDRLCALLPQTDLGNAERFKVRFGHMFRFCRELGWFRWDGRRWALLTEEKDKTPGEVMLAVFQTIRAIRNEADLVEASRCRDDLPDDATAEEKKAALDYIVKITKQAVTLFSDTIRAHAKSSEGASRIGAVASLAKSFGSIAIDAKQLDADIMALNVMNGTLRIVNDGNVPVMKLFPHNPKDLITKMATVFYDERATCPNYDRFFERVMPDQEDRRFLHQWAGLSSTGDIGYHKMAFFYGMGRNGKSTWTDIIAHILGDYSQVIKFDTFLEQSNKRKGSDATPDLAQLPGVRFLRTSEPEKGAKLAEALIKEVTGGEPIQARHLNKGFFSFLPSFKLTAQGNYKPKITGHDDGIWGRVRLVPWTVRIPDSEIDIRLPAKLKEEASGVLNRMMAGLIDLKMNGLTESANVKAATAKYREASDQLGKFLRDCTVDKEGARTRSSELLEVFNEWVKESGGAEWTPQGFAKAMEDRGYERKTSNGVWWLDIEATVDAADVRAGNFGTEPKTEPPPDPSPPPVPEPALAASDGDDWVPPF
ncbi:phage/plasmid primase, P4 family [Sphingobium agri]|uniref:Phage/plasmid primase, P4 family n=1 Tax=Sphingobium agri TaxID=2933566 RepID=A0ABT0E219_9SPHN|nr:phage/plasmid primase, P4 family [Sphingobium agri]MCK0533415.1 phage/plasmid primase, P4 family [Sphingobium agri]